MNKEKININMYGGKSVFGGRETRCNVDIIYCDKYKDCSFYKNNKCFCAGRWKSDCKYGSKKNIQGYTSRADKYNEFRNKYKNDKCYNKLDEPKNYIGQIGDEIVLNLPYIHNSKEKGVFQDVSFARDELAYINKINFNNEFIKKVCDFIPRTIFENVAIKGYKDKVIPNFLYELKNDFTDIYNNFINEFPEYKEYEPNFVGKYANISTLANGTELKDWHNNIWIKENDTIVCYKYKTWLPFYGEPTETRIKISNGMKYEIEDNSQVDENTKFVD